MHRSWIINDLLHCDGEKKRLVRSWNEEEEWDMKIVSFLDAVLTLGRRDLRMVELWRIVVAVGIWRWDGFFVGLGGGAKCGLRQELTKSRERIRVLMRL